MHIAWSQMVPIERARTYGLTAGRSRSPVHAQRHAGRAG